jgi:hypothetical protein
MKALALTGLLFIAPLMALSQSLIRGRVVNEANQSPIPGSSVFVSNTSKGTTTDKNGYFELTDLPAGKHQLIISSIGYETNVFAFSSDQLPLQLKIELGVKVQELKNVTVEPYSVETWEKWGKTFIENLIGTTPNAAACRIKNSDVVHFRYYKKSNRLVAFADEPLILENKALGYRIKYQMENFEVNFSRHSTFFAGFPLFTEMGDRSRWRRNRDKAYYGSMMHFMYCIYRDSLAQQGFEVRRMKRVQNEEKIRVRNLYRELHLPGRDSLRAALKDSMEYFERVLRQEDHKDIVSRNPLNADSLIVESEGAYKAIYFPDYLYVIYKNETEDAEYLLQMREHRNRTFQTSIITLMSGNPIVIDLNGGYYPPDEVYASAYWGWSEKMADCLPIDYRPTREP